MSEEKISEQDQMKLKKAKFQEENKKTLCIYNLTNTAVSIGLALATFLILNGDETVCEGVNIRISLWLVMTMHIINAIEAVFDYTGLDNIFCCCPCVLTFGAYEIGTLIYMNSVFFSSGYCADKTPTIYYWLMTNVIVFYVTTAIWVFFKIKIWLS